MENNIFGHNYVVTYRTVQYIYSAIHMCTHIRD